MKLSKKIKFNDFLLVGILLFTVLSGAVRKWITNNGGINNIITLMQILVVYLLVFIKGRSTLSNKNIAGIFFIYVSYLVIAAFNPLSPSIYHTISGLIIHLSFWLGLFVYIANRDFIKFDRFYYLILVLIILEAILAIIQYQMPRESAINQYVIEQEFDEESALKIAMVGNAVRVTGTFSYIAGFSAFVLFVQLFSFSLFYREDKNKHFAVIGVALSLILAFLTGSRSTTIINIFLTISFFVFQLRNYNYKQLISILGGLFLIISINLSIGDPLHTIDFVSNSYENLDTRFEDNRDEGQGRILTPINTLINNEFPNKIIGNGLGISYPAIVAVKGTSKVAETFWVQDDEIGRTLLEGGYILLMLKLLLIITVLKLLQMDKRFMTIAFSLIFIYMPLTTNIYNIVFFLMGIIYLEQAILRSKNAEISLK